MAREIRIKERVLEPARVESLLEEGFYGVLSMVSADGGGYGVPINYVRAGNTIYFHCAKSGHKIESIRKNPLVSLAVVGKTENLPEQFTARYESVIVFGTARVLEDKDEVLQALRLLCQKYTPGLEDAAEQYIAKYLSRVAVVAVEVSQISGKRSTE